MTGVEIVLLGLGCMIALAVTLLVANVRIASRNIVAAIKDRPTAFVDEKAVGNLHRIALAAEKAANDRPAQIESQRIQDINEALVQGFTTVIDTPITHLEGLKDDIVTGRNQADQELKARLRDQLAAALAITRQ